MYLFSAQNADHIWENNVELDLGMLGKKMLIFFIMFSRWLMGNMAEQNLDFKNQIIMFIFFYPSKVL